MCMHAHASVPVHTCVHVCVRARLCVYARPCLPNTDRRFAELFLIHISSRRYRATCLHCVQDWLATVVMKQAAFHALAEYYQSVVAQQTKSYGEEIARLQVSWFESPAIAVCHWKREREKGGREREGCRDREGEREGGEGGVETDWGGGEREGRNREGERESGKERERCRDREGEREEEEERERSVEREGEKERGGRERERGRGRV